MDSKRNVVGPERCPDCGSFDLAKVARRTSLHGEIQANVCKVVRLVHEPSSGSARRRSIEELHAPPDAAIEGRISVTRPGLTIERMFDKMGAPPP